MGILEDLSRLAAIFVVLLAMGYYSLGCLGVLAVILLIRFGWMLDF